MLKHTQPQAPYHFYVFPSNALLPHVCHRGLRDISPGYVFFFFRGSHLPDVVDWTYSFGQIYSIVSLDCRFLPTFKDFYAPNLLI